MDAQLVQRLAGEQPGEAGEHRGEIAVVLLAGEVQVLLLVELGEKLLGLAAKRGKIERRHGGSLLRQGDTGVPWNCEHSTKSANARTCPRDLLEVDNLALAGALGARDDSRYTERHATQARRDH